MLPGKVVAWALAKYEKAHGLDPGGQHLYGPADKPGAAPGALQLQHAAPTRAPYPEHEPAWPPCKPQ